MECRNSLLNHSSKAPVRPASLNALNPIEHVCWKSCLAISGLMIPCVVSGDLHPDHLVAIRFQRLARARSHPLDASWTCDVAGVVADDRPLPPARFRFRVLGAGRTPLSAFRIIPAQIFHGSLGRRLEFCPRTVVAAGNWQASVLWSLMQEEHL